VSRTVRPAIIVLLSWALVCLLAAGAAGQRASTQVRSRSSLIGPQKNKKPIHITADNMEADNKRKTVVFIGRVKTVQGDMNLFCDRLIIFYIEAKAPAKPAGGAPDAPSGGSGGLFDAGGSGRQIKHITALGHVKLVQKNRVAMGRRADFFRRENRVVLQGDAKVWDGRNTLTGERITVFLDEDRSIVEGGPTHRVQATIFPAEAKNR
jgi:lipopolysaccharide export system protein LptA